MEKGDSSEKPKKKSGTLKNIASFFKRKKGDL
jgi:hypothetical protein